MAYNGINKDRTVVSQTRIAGRLKKEGIKVLVDHKAINFKSNKLICDHKGKEKVIEFDQVLLALGRSPNINGFGLSELGVKIRNNGTIQANQFLQTNISNIFVCGEFTYFALCPLIVLPPKPTILSFKAYIGKVILSINLA